MESERVRREVQERVSVRWIEGRDREVLPAAGSVSQKMFFFFFFLLFFFSRGEFIFR